VEEDTMLYSVFCDESCHLEHDQQRSMTLGAIYCPTSFVHEANTTVRQIKAEHGFNPRAEVKWIKVSAGGVPLYSALLEYFFAHDELHFRGLVIPDKSKLDHEGFGQTHDEWYYKMYFEMLKAVLSPVDRYRIYVDIKDTRSANRVAKLQQVLCNNMYDFSFSIIERIQTVRSDEVELLQLTDLLIGALSYAHRGLLGNKGKQDLIDLIRRQARLNLMQSTLPRANKFNLFVWQAQAVGR
jgi:hypothetical protein